MSVSESVLRTLCMFCVVCALFCQVSAEASAVPLRADVAAPPAGGVAGVEVLIISLTVGYPFAGLTLVPLIGNAVVLGKKYKRKTRRAWGIAGVLMGGVGLLGGLALVGVAIASNAHDFVVFPLPLIGISATSLGLGLVNVIKASSQPNPRLAGLRPPPHRPDASSFLLQTP